LHIDFIHVLRHHAGIRATRAQQARISVRSQAMKRNAKKLSLALLLTSSLTVGAFAGSAALKAQSQPSSADKQPTTAPAASPSSAKPQTPSPAPNSAGTVWVNTDTGAYHKQGTRWYGKTKHGKYMLEADAVKAGYKPAK
jgi:hypothetical protein